MKRSGLVLALTLALLAPGCLGGVSAAGIPKQRLDAAGWTERDRTEQSVALGLGSLALVDYGPTGTTSGLGAGITVATTNNVPILDETRFIPIALERIEEERGVTFEDPTDREFQLTGLGTTVTATEYTIRGGPAPGKGLVFTPACDDFVVVAAWGATVSPSGGLLGGGGGSTLYQQALDVAKHVTCG